MWIKKLFPVLFFGIALCAHAQENATSPEINKMYHDADDYITKGNFKQAIVTYRQMLPLVHDKTDISVKLANAYYLQGDYSKSEDLLEALIDKPSVTDVAYKILAMDQLSLQHSKEAKKTLRNGLKKFDRSGMLYFQKGKMLMEEGNEPDAVRSWTMSISMAPKYTPNYREAAVSFFGSDDVLPGLIYGEEYLAMQHDTTGDDAFKSSLYIAWRVFFDQLAEPKSHLSPTPAALAITNIYRQLTPVISDGIATENLTMVRTRFIMEWLKQQNTYSIALFSYQNDLAANGWLDLYDQYLFGAAESKARYDAWNKFHEGDMQRFTDWQASHYLHPVAEQPQLFSDGDLRHLFSKKKKR